MSEFRKLLLRLLHIAPQKVPQYFAIPSLDKPILKMICQHLLLVDQVCLSLSFKDLLGLFGVIVKHEDLEFSRLLRIKKSNSMREQPSPYVL